MGPEDADPEMCDWPLVNHTETAARELRGNGPPSSMRAELSAIVQAIADAATDVDSCLDYSLDFPEWLRSHPGRVLLLHVVDRINAQVRASAHAAV